MPRTSSKARSDRGLTFIELGAAITLLALFAAAVAPAFVRLAENQRAYRFREEALAVCAQAREAALSRGSDVTVAFNESGDALVATLASEEDTLVARASVPDSISADGAGSWTAVFHPDGTAEADPLEVADGAGVRYLVVRADGRVAWAEEPPEEGDSRWRAGDYEQRT
ncbi:MAG: GspH/FimT family pseudopilin [Fimbriimonadales bacterium]|nr:GspH/FimT family pseudopilin [Fimbriimonadales bacterium]